MKTHRTHETRKEFVKPKLICFQGLFIVLHIAKRKWGVFFRS